MSDNRRGPRASDRDQQPVLSRLDRAEGQHGAGWRPAAAVIGIILVGVVVAGRLGMDEVAPVAPPTSSPVAVVSPSPSLSADSTERPSQPRPAQPEGIDAVPDVPRHLDGIPTSIGGERVYRLASALDRGGERPILVGGWYIGPDCLRPGRCVGRLADSPATALRSTWSVALEGLIELGTGPRVLRASLREECWAVLDRSRCFPTLSVMEVLWRGDFFTRTGPIDVQPMLSALQYAFPELRPEPFRDFARCTIDWPPQTYRSTRGGPRMTLVFPTVEDRIAAEAAIVANWPRPADDGAGQCLDHFMATAQPAGWMSSGNLMIWAAHDEGVRALVQAAVLDAMVHSPASEAVVPQPATTWAALRGLRRWDPGLDILPPHDFEVWAADLPTEAYALNDPLVRVLLIFPTRAERRSYQQSVSADDVIVLEGVPPTQETVGRGLISLREVDVRWLGYRNVLLQVIGPAGFDGQLREALAADIR